MHEIEQQNYQDMLVVVKMYLYFSFVSQMPFICNS